MRALVSAALVATVLVADSGRSLAAGESITDVRIMGNSRTTEDTIRSLAGVRIGETLEEDTLASVRERLNTSGLFADVNVWWEGKGDGVRINIAVKDKFPWAPVPTGSWSANSKSLGLLFVHGNLFGRGKQMLLGARLSSLDSGAVLAYRDPSLFGSWIYWELKAVAQRQIIPEFDVNQVVPLSPWRESTFDSFGFEPAVGVAWFRRVRTQVSWRLDKVNYVADRQHLFDADGNRIAPAPDTPVTSRGGVMGIGRALLSFDWRAREHSILMGSALTAALDFSSPTFKSDFDFWRGSLSWEHGIRVFRSHNFVYAFGGTVGRNTPIWWDVTAGGGGLRGYLVQQFRGDSQLGGRAEYHFPLFSIGPLDFRALGFYDSVAIWNRSLPEGFDPSGQYLVRSGYDQRSFDPRYAASGLKIDRDLHNDVGGGLRFFLRSVAVPLVGFDAGYGLEARHWRFILIVGA